MATKDDSPLECEPLSTTSSANSSEDKGEREQWRAKCDSFLSFLGFAVGLGNLWRFPYIAMRNGGGAFLIPFLTIITVCGLPLYFMELSLGQFSGRSASHCWEVCPLFKGVGVGMIICISVMGLYYNIIIAWTLYYLGSSFISPLPWTNCDHSWNTPSCVQDRTSGNGSLLPPVFSNGTEGNYSLLQNETFLNQSVAPSSNLMTSEEEFWQFKALTISSGIDEIGTISWHLTLCFFAAWLLVYLCLIKGVKSVGKVVYVTATLPYILLTVFLVRGLLLPGSHDGVMFYLKPEWHRILDIQVWIEATIQVFYSLGPAWGPMITMASYNKFDNNCYRDVFFLTFASEGTSIFGGFVVFSILGFMAAEAGVPIADIVKSGPGLGFVVYPEAVSMFPIPNFWAILFFLMLLTVGLDTQFVHVEALITAMMDTAPSLRKRRIFVTGIVCAIFFLAGLVMCTQGGIYIFQLMDWYIASVSLPLFGLMECVVFAWIYGADRFSNDIKIMLNRGVPIPIRICWCIITPFILFALLCVTIVTYRPPTYGTYRFPDYCTWIGLLLALIPIIPIPVYAVITVRNSPGDSILEKIKYSLKPSELWAPASKEHAKHYNIQDTKIRGSFLRRIRINLFGK